MIWNPAPDCSRPAPARGSAAWALAILEKYGHHLPGCAVFSGAEPCSCGYRDALREMRAAVAGARPASVTVVDVE